MLKITVKKEGESLETWDLEGRLSGEWVNELDRFWKGRPSAPASRLHINLKSVSYVDASGKELLKEMHRRGVEINGCGCMIRAVVEEIQRHIATLYPRRAPE